MPRLDMDVDPDDFLSSCNKHEIQSAIEWLTENGHINKPKTGTPINETRSFRHEIFQRCIFTLNRNYDSLTNDEEEVITKLAKKYGNF